MGICRAYKSVDLVREEPIRVTVESTVFGPDKVQYAVGPLDAGRLGMGLGAEVTQEILRYGFNELGLHRIDLRVLAHNTRGIRCYVRGGFVEEGREREAGLRERRLARRGDHGNA